MKIRKFSNLTASLLAPRVLCNKQFMFYTEHDNKWHLGTPNRDLIMDTKSAVKTAEHHSHSLLELEAIRERELDIVWFDQDRKQEIENAKQSKVCSTQHPREQFPASEGDTV